MLIIVKFKLNCLFLSIAILIVSIDAYSLSCIEVVSRNITVRKLMTSFLNVSFHGLPFSELIDDQGNIYIFRVVTRVPKFDKNYGFSNTISYSLSPHILAKWMTEHSDSYLIVSKQKVSDNSLVYAGWSSSEGHLDNEPINENTKVHRGRMLDEVRIEFEDQKPEVFIKVSELEPIIQTLTEEFGAKTVRPVDFFRRLVQEIRRN